MKRLALLSVTDKTGIVEFARGLARAGFEIMSTGGTAEVLRDADVDVMGVSYYTGMPEIFDGRVKTLHPKIHGGLLAKPAEVKHREEMEELNIRRIEVLAVNLYPFEKTVLSGASREDVIENIDIGGPAMIRAAAKNAENVLVAVDPADYDEALRNLTFEGNQGYMRKLQAKAFAHTAFYDALVSEYLSDAALPEGESHTMAVGLRMRNRLRYGENPHQAAGVFVRPFHRGGVVGAKQVWGKEMSYNNFLDADAAWELASDLHRLHDSRRRPVVIVKHGNPCGAAWTEDPVTSFEFSKSADPISAFGGIVAVPGELGKDAAEALAAKGNFFEVIVCGEITDDALLVFNERSGWGQDVRILVAGAASAGGFLTIRSLRGGALVQDADTEDPVEWRSVTLRRPDEREQRALRNAWTVVRHVKSNAIVIASELAVLGVGAGQMNRVQSVRLAIEQAGSAAAGATLASDAFFPFPDSLHVAAEAGIFAIVQPGGSKKDPEVIEAANALGMAMVFTGVRHFRH